MTRTPDKLWHDAVHEAGHAVIARVLGVNSGYANLVPDYEEQTPSHAFIFDALQAWEWNRLHPRRSGDDRPFWRGRVIATMAGVEAEREIIGWCAGDAEHDCRRCDPMGDNPAYSNGPPELSARMRRFARQLVKRHRNAILSFAEQLIAADELDELLAR